MGGGQQSLVEPCRARISSGHSITGLTIQTQIGHDCDGHLEVHTHLQMHLMPIVVVPCHMDELTEKQVHISLIPDDDTLCDDIFELLFEMLLQLRFVSLAC